MEEFKSLTNSDNHFLCFLNIRSSQCFIETLPRKPVAICLCETWLTENDDLHYHSLNGYSPIITKDGASAKGKGIALFLKDDVSYKIIDTSSSLEHLIVKITHGKNVSNLCTAYKPPSFCFSAFEESLEEILAKMNP